LAPAVQVFDAIGNDVMGMREVFAEAGHEVAVFAESWSPALADHVEALEPRAAIWEDRSAILIYHHSTKWPRGEALLERTANRIVIRHHNVTPPAFFEPYSPDHRTACAEGVESTRKLAALGGARYWCDSAFNAGELVSYGAAWGNCRILPPLNRVSALLSSTTDLSLYGRLERRTVILFTGGIKPNKGHKALIEAFSVYQRRFNSRSALLLAGGIDERLRGYVHELQSLALVRGVRDSVIFTGAVSEAELRFCYERADIFACVSDHEGFCVPLVEAMAFGLPIVGAARTAAPETVGEAGLMFEEPDSTILAEAVNFLSEQPETAAALGRKARRRYGRLYAPEALHRQTRRLLGELETGGA